MLLLDREVLNLEMSGIDAVRAKRPQYVPTVLTKEEAIAVIQQCDGIYQLVVKLLYGSGLRLIEGFAAIAGMKGFGRLVAVNNAAIAQDVAEGPGDWRVGRRGSRVSGGIVLTAIDELHGGSPELGEGGNGVETNQWGKFAGLKGYAFFKVSVQQRAGQRIREERVTTRMSCSPKRVSGVMVRSPEFAWGVVFVSVF